MENILPETNYKDFNNKMNDEISRDSQKVHDFKSLIDFLRDTLHWPIPDNGLEFQDITFDWLAEALELDVDTRSRVIGCWQLRLFDLRFLESQEPWGVFFVQFNNDVEIDFSGTILRSVLQGLVDGNNHSASLPFWKRDRVLFVCTTVDFLNFGFVYFEGVKYYPVFRGYTPMIHFKLGD